MTTFTNCPAGIGDASDARNEGIGSSAVLVRLNMLSDVVESLRSLARIQPFCTNVSLPSGRTSLIVACRSTSGVDDRTQMSTAPEPMTVVFVPNGAERYDTEAPDGYCCQLQSHWE